MKKLLLLVAMVLFCITGIAQQERFLVFEFMKVNSDQETNYWETETFWEKIHAERVRSGEIKGWDLWSLKPGGAEQGYQYLTVTIYDNPVKALSDGDVWNAAKKAYPAMTEEELRKALELGEKSRELSKRMFMKVIAATKDKFVMEVGTVMRMNFMEAIEGKFDNYEKAEMELFLPIHQTRVDAGTMSHWALSRVLMPSGSKVPTTHMTFDMFTGYLHYFDAYGRNEVFNVDAETQNKIDAAIKTRDLNWTYLGTMKKTVK
ncbi:hypothetical protein BZG02_07495 [Labilibaculum filiforme]|uniref:Uncharacterized protein n=1 Tax=Labilibaculum filiforme TaxID=1940526 RepID=A0A2N3I0K3_9BACT|nr:hypothetical protein [Labilibaculum filiforme]PKQ63855.1 hypothetical protein BZG02_07495 [Labilibaculum filiforme]